MAANQLEWHRHSKLTAWRFLRMRRRLGFPGAVAVYGSRTGNLDPTLISPGLLCRACRNGDNSSNIPSTITRTASEMKSHVLLFGRRLLRAFLAFWKWNTVNRRLSFRQDRLEISDNISRHSGAKLVAPADYMDIAQLWLLLTFEIAQDTSPQDIRILACREPLHHC